MAGHRPAVRRGSPTGQHVRAGPRSWYTRRRGGPTRPNTDTRPARLRVHGTASLPDRDKSGHAANASGTYQHRLRLHAVREGGRLLMPTSIPGPGTGPWEQDRWVT